MGIAIANKFAIRNIKANKVFLIPFILSSGIMIALFNIMSSLLNNDYVKHSNATLPVLMSMGLVIVGIFSSIFIVYANRFIIKRRNKEFSLYRMMGLEKRHIIRIILLEEVLIFAMITAISIIGGYLIGKLIFLFVNKLTQNVIVSLSNYYFSTNAAISTIMYMGVLFLVIFIINVKNITTSSPIELLSKSYSGEKEPKSKFAMMVAGIIILSIGYILALVTKGNLKSLGMFFLAAILVIIGSYILFVTLSIVILKMMKNNKNRYYKAENFISISGMIYRMKENAVGLASIAVLCTGVIITIAATYTIYSSMNDIVDSINTREYRLEINGGVGVDNMTQIYQYRKMLENKVYSSVSNKDDIKDMYISEEVYLPVSILNGRILSPNQSQDKNAKNIFITLNKDHDYSRLIGKNVKLNDDEIIYVANSKEIGGFKRLILNGKKMIAIEDDKNISVPKNIAIESIKLIVNPKVYNEVVKNYRIIGANRGELGYGEENIYINWNLKHTPNHYARKMDKIAKSSNLSFKSRESVMKDLKELYGGILFLGIVVGVIFLIGTVLITYYKQLSEGYDDRRNYQIMKKVGLSDQLIRKTAGKQIGWMFFIPLLVALLHSLVASKIVFQLLQIFGLRSYAIYAGNIAIVLGIFSGLYFVIFKVTSVIYYNIVTSDI